MLLLWDRNFFSYKLLKLVKDKNAQLLARIKSNLIFKPIQELSDGSYLAKAYASSRDREKDKNGILVRIIERGLSQEREYAEIRPNSAGRTSGISQGFYGVGELFLGGVPASTLVVFRPWCQCYIKMS
jgi:hypothetical protein